MKKTSMILCGMMLLASSALAQVKVIAHRGYWNSLGAAQNSIVAMQNAKKADVWGSEFDVHITTDGIVVVNHDDDIHGIIIEEAKYADIKNLKLANGEPIATLKSYLEAGKKLAPMQLILEIKAHQTPEREDRCVKACLDLVKAAGMEKQVDYISFSMHACEELVKLNPQARVYYLGSDVAPEVIKQKGFAGIDYYGGALLKNPNWIKESHDMGMKVNVWTIDQMKEIQKCVDSGVDFITTNKLEEAKKIAEGKLCFK
jgi:glycerophosphoryl diester phosphodiesterase